MGGSVLIVGGGLAGLTAARSLHQAGMRFLLVEARDRLGGRILSVDAAGRASFGAYDLGPSWFWPGMNPLLDQLISDLRLKAYPQNVAGDVLFQQSVDAPPYRHAGFQQTPPSMRLAGGTNAIIAALSADLPASSIRLGTEVAGIALDGAAIEVELSSSTGNNQIRASQIILALPPRVLAASITFSPAIDERTRRSWENTQTWMAPHAKFVALYDRPFWRDSGLCGTAQSMVGPLAEIHDATTAEGHAALFGFVGVPAERRAVVSESALVEACIRQLSELFGPLAGVPRATLYKDWSADRFTATPLDTPSHEHLIAIEHSWISGVWRNHAFLAGSETSHSHPGYLAGAVEAGMRAATEVIARQNAMTVVNAGSGN